MSTGPAGPDPRRLLIELRALEREIVERGYVRRADALERTRDVVRRLGEVGSPERLLDRAAEELGVGSGFDRVLISEVVDRELHPRAIWGSEAPQAIRIALEYPLIEEEVARTRGAAVVSGARDRPRMSIPLASVLGGDSYAVVALGVGGAVVGLVHASADGRALDDVDLEVLERFSEGFAGVFERAMLRETLRRHRVELQSAVQWMSARLGRLAAGPAELVPAALARTDLGDALTRREREVLALMARGQTNLAIAGALLVREGTIKYHVKNILRKLGATSRADAVARYARAGVTGT